MPVVEACTDISLPLSDRRAGKVRVSYALPDTRRLFVTTDRLSAFDRIVANVPYKGQVLNQLAAWWFMQTRNIVNNHFIDCPDPNATIGHAAQPLPVEVVVRGVITGSTSTSLWRQYDQGARNIYGYAGAHDEPLTCAEVTQRGLVDTDVWNIVQEAALALFAYGQDVAQRAGLLLADTKYEFGIAADGSVMLIDEMHTPDSSRFWELSSYQQRLSAGAEPESLDKEPVRLALDAVGYRGDGDPPPLDDLVIAATTDRYIAAYTRLTGEVFKHGEYPVQSRLLRSLQQSGIV